MIPDLNNLIPTTQSFCYCEAHLIQLQVEETGSRKPPVLVSECNRQSQSKWCHCSRRWSPGPGWALYVWTPGYGGFNRRKGKTWVLFITFSKWMLMERLGEFSTHFAVHSTMDSSTVMGIGTILGYPSALLVSMPSLDFSNIWPLPPIIYLVFSQTLRLVNTDHSLKWLLLHHLLGTELTY